MGQIENPLKSKLVKAGQAFGDYAVRVEDQYAVGRPDIWYAPKAGRFPTCLIEAKVVTGGTFHPTPRQWLELERYQNTDLTLNLRRSLMLGFKDNLFLLHQAAENVKVKDCLVSDPDEPFHLFIRRFLQ